MAWKLDIPRQTEVGEDDEDLQRGNCNAMRQVGEITLPGGEQRPGSSVSHQAS